MILHEWMLVKPIYNKNVSSRPYPCRETWKGKNLSPESEKTWDTVVTLGTLKTKQQGSKLHKGSKFYMTSKLIFSRMDQGKILTLGREIWEQQSTEFLKNACFQTFSAIEVKFLSTLCYRIWEWIFGMNINLQYGISMLITACADRSKPLKFFAFLFCFF